MTACQYSYLVDRREPRYFKDLSLERGWPQAHNKYFALDLAASGASQLLCCSAPWLYISVLGWMPFRASHGMNILQQAHCKWRQSLIHSFRIFTAINANTDVPNGVLLYRLYQKIFWWWTYFLIDQAGRNHVGDIMFGRY